MHTTTKTTIQCVHHVQCLCIHVPACTRCTCTCMYSLIHVHICMNVGSLNIRCQCQMYELPLFLSLSLSLSLSGNRLHHYSRVLDPQDPAKLRPLPTCPQLFWAKPRPINSSTPRYRLTASHGQASFFSSLLTLALKF